LAPDRKVWKAPMNMVRSVQVVLEAAGKCMANGATFTGKLGNDFCYFECFSKVNRKMDLFLC
jgi:hypothetical protein